MMIGKCAASVLAVTGVILAASAAIAADIAVEAAPVDTVIPGREWTFSLAPYFWGAGLAGDVGLFGRDPVDIDMSFGDIFDNLRFGGMIVGEAHNGTWGLMVDVIYVKIEDEESFTRPLAGFPVSLDANVETSSLTATIMGEYRAISQPTATVDLMAGARIWSVDNDIEASLSAGGPPLAAFSGSDGSTWVDPIIGLKGRFDINPSWHVTGWGMVGGFGAASDITWDVFAGVGYQWNEWLSLVAGYRALGVDSEDDGFVYDVVQQGPVFGAVVKF